MACLQKLLDSSRDTHIPPPHEGLGMKLIVIVELDADCYSFGS